MTEHPRIILLTGDGKGKTTAAFGMALRAAGHGLRVCVIQFIKQSDDTGEARALRLLPGTELHVCGKGFVRQSDSDTLRGSHCAAAAAGLALAREKLADAATHVVVLDELCSVPALGLLPLQPILDCLAAAAPGKVIILTGRDASQALIDLADTVSHIHAVKHPYPTLPAQPGVEF
ncbi:MAG: cob(I)yrinic acid a,c-diamide adenosyltransferase [Kiritimatiellaeota bacterium]|nr:cob(I)yrinic acid a,c-diamide adenosyltransferase [Kiritimatiellota bacterium]